MRSFQPKWLHLYKPWLIYSKNQHGGFCNPCIIFATGYRGNDPGVPVCSPPRNLTKALEILKKHQEKEYHHTAVIQADKFLQRTEGKPDIHQHIEQGLSDRIAQNRKKLGSIIDTVVLCGCQNIALRGQHDSAKDAKTDETANHTNFRALLNFRAEAGDDILAKHLENTGKNATYTLADIQNQLICILGHQIHDQILNKVKKAPWFTVIADEVTDTSDKEQLSLVLRLVSQVLSEVRVIFK